MKKVISAVLTAAMVVGMGVSVLAATPSVGCDYGKSCAKSLVL